MDKFKLMSTFIQVVRSGSYAAAAEELRVSKPLISKHISALEEALGAQLLYRTTRRLQLTEIGREYHAQCKQILAATERAEQGILRLQEEPRGHIRITSLQSIGVLFLATAISDFSARYSGLRTTLVLSDSLSFGKEILEGGFDLAVHFGSLPDSRIVARTLCQVQRYVCCSPAYLRTHGVPSSPQDLSSHNCLVHLAQAPDDLWRFAGTPAGFAVKVRGTIMSNSMLVLRETALQGNGLALLPAFCVERDIERGDLVKVLFDHPLESAPLCVLYPQAHMVSKKVRTFIDFLANWLTPRTWTAPEPESLALRKELQEGERRANRRPSHSNAM